jgi:hypothetical protein
MIVRIFVAVFASLVGGLSYLTGLAKLMTAFLLGFGAVCSFLLGILFVLPVDANRLFFPIYEKVPAWPYFLVGAALAGMIPTLFLLKRQHAPLAEAVSAIHFKYLFGAVAGYLISLFASSVYWFPSEVVRRSADTSALASEVLFGTCLFLVGVTISCGLFYRASKGCSERHPDLMRRFVLGLFAFFQLDKMPLLVAYLLIYSPETGIIFPHLAALALASYIPVGIFLLRTTLDSQEM